MQIYREKEINCRFLTKKGRKENEVFFKIGRVAVKFNRTPTF